VQPALRSQLCGQLCGQPHSKLWRKSRSQAPSRSRSQLPTVEKSGKKVGGGGAPAILKKADNHPQRTVSGAHA